VTSPAPYVTPAELQAAPTGIGWSTIPSASASPLEQLAEVANICTRATHMVDAYCNQPLRADVAMEELLGPDFRITAPQGGFSNVRILCSRWPVTQVVGAQVAPASTFPPAWLPIPLTSLRLGFNEVQTVSPVGGTDASGAGAMFIEMASGYITWAGGRNNWRCQFAYISGWPHTVLTAAANAGDTSLQVDDVTGWAGAGGQVYDGASTEGVKGLSVSATTPMQVLGATVETGPGTIELVSPLAYPHAVGTMVSALPWNIIWATILLAASQALVRGATAIVAPGLPGSMQGAGAGPSTLAKDAYELLKPYRRIM
jgi:hypothetical protein